MSKKTPENVPVEKLRAIWQQVSISDWLNLFQELRPSVKWLQSGNIIKGQCIYHTDNNPSMVINLERRMAHCFGCHRTVYSPITFVSDLGQIGSSAALSKLKNRFGIRLPSAYMQNLQQIEDNQMLKFALMRAMNTEMVDAICNPDKPEYAYIKDSGLVKWLEERKIPTDVAHVWPVGVLMPQERMAMRLEQSKQEKLVEPAYRYFTDGKTKYLAAPGAKLVHEGSIVFFYFTSPTSIGRLRIRHPGTKEFYAVEDPYEESFGVFGLNTFSELLGNLEKRALIFTEGEMDALSHIAHQSSRACNDICMVGIGGGMGAGQDMDTYVDLGFAEGWVAQDNDTDGVGFAKKLLSNNSSLRRVFNWTDADTLKTVKDIDQAYQVYGFDTFYERMTNVETFSRNYDWAVDQVSKEIEKIDPSDILARTEKASEFGTTLKEESERKVYVDKVSSVYSLDSEQIRNSMLPDDDDDQAFLRRLIHKLRTDEYFFLTEKQLRGSPVLIAWSRRKKVMRTFSMSSAQTVAAALSMDLGLLEWYIQKELGEPAHLQYTVNLKGEPIALNSLKKAQLITKAFYDAVTACADTAMPLERLVELHQGIHYIAESVDTGQPVVFIVNGPHFFMGTFENDDFKFEKLDCPVHGNYFLQLKSKPWSRDLVNLSDIEDAYGMNPAKVFSKLCKVFNTGWKFKDHDLVVRFLAADVLYTPIATAFEHMVLTAIGGESQSGKSTLMQVISGRAYPDLKLCDATVVQDDFSAASIRQAMAGSSLRLFLDEFEDSDFGSFRPERKARVVREIQDIFRTIGSGSEVYRGTTAGDARYFFLYFPVTTGGIFSLKQTRDINRYVQVKTTHISGFKNPVEAIRSKFTFDEMRELRRNVTLCLIPHIARLVREQREVKAEFAGNSQLKPGTDDRLKQNLMPAVTIMKLIKQDYGKFLAQFSSLKMEEMDEQGATQESLSIWNAILNTPISLSAHDPNMFGTATIAQMLANANMYAGMLNGTDIGVYHLPEHKWMVVHWHKVIGGVLRNDNNYRGTQHPGRLKVVADEDGRVIPKEKVTKRFLQKHVWPRVGTKVTTSDITVFDVSDTVVSMVSENKEENDEEDRRKMLDDIPEGNVKRGNFKK